MKEFYSSEKELITISDLNDFNEYKGYLMKIEKKNYLLIYNNEITEEMINENQQIHITLEKCSLPSINLKLNKNIKIQKIKTVTFIHLPKNKYDEKYFLKEDDEIVDYYEEEIELLKKSSRFPIKIILFILVIILIFGFLFFEKFFSNSKKEFDTEEKFISFGQYITCPEKGKSGINIINYKNGLRYVGNFKSGEANGEGVIYDGFGEVLLEGNYTKGILKNGTLYDKFFTYTGRFKNGSFNKYGEIQYNNFQKSILKEENFYTKDGFRYEGYWTNGLKNGKGKMIYEYDKKKKPKIYYIGDWKNDKKNGRGMLYYGKTDFYDGSWENNLKHGLGQIYKNGKLSFEGTWVQDIKNGRGMTYDQTGMKTYEGEWINNKKNGRGKLFYEDGDYYDGNFVNDKRHGIGMVLSKGRIACSGNFIEDYFDSGKIEFENKHCQKLQ